MDQIKRKHDKRGIKPFFGKDWTEHYINAFNPLTQALLGMVESFDPNGDGDEAQKARAFAVAKTLLRQMGEIE